MNINPGELNKRIKIVKLEGMENENGFQEGQQEIIVRKTYAKVTRTSIKEIMNAGQEASETKCRFLVRYTPKEITREMFVVYRGTYYQIEYVNNYGDSDKYVEIMTAAGMA